MNIMTIDQKLILLSARKAGLKSLQGCMAEGHNFPLSTVQMWWQEAKDKVVEIGKIAQEISEEIEAES